MEEKKKTKLKFSNFFLWIIFLMIVLFVFLSALAETGIYYILPYIENFFGGASYAVIFIDEYYTPTIGSFITLILVCLIIRKNRFILRSFLPKGRGKNHKIKVIEDTYSPSQNNTAAMLLMGIALGGLTNFVCIYCAMIHGDIKFSFSFDAAIIPTMLFALLMVFIQSASEELWCRGFMYERICIHYPVWVAVLINGILFGLLHIFNDGVSVLAIISIIVGGVSFTLVRWYTGSIWVPIGIHTMWNFTQNFIFGLPNSGLVSEFSILELEAAKGKSNLVYDYAFGVEGALPAIFVNLAIIAVILILAKQNGHLRELNMSYEKNPRLQVH